MGGMGWFLWPISWPQAASCAVVARLQAVGSRCECVEGWLLFLYVWLVICEGLKVKK